MPGLSFAEPRPDSGGAAPLCTMEMLSERDLDARWPLDHSSRVAEERFGDEAEPARTIDFDPEVGYRLYARHFGLALVSPDGARVLCAPPESSPWRWQRFLVGRILPLAAVARGIECFHASAVTLDGRAVGLVGPSGAGKTSLAASLSLAGAGYLTDDVLALEPVDDWLLAHPGSAVASLRPTEESLLSRGEGEVTALGEVLGQDDKTYVAVDRAQPACRLGAVYFLTPNPGSPPVAPLKPADPRLLLASTFIFSIRTAQRLANQLDVCAALAAAVPMFTLSVGGQSSPRELAAVLMSHARQELAREAS